MADTSDFSSASEGTILAGIDENRSLRARGAEGRGNQHSRRYHAAERVLIAADGNGDGLSGRNRTLRQIGGETDSLAVVSARGTEWASCGVSADTARNSKGPSRRKRTETKRVRSSTRRRSASASMTADYVWSSVEDVGDLSQDFGAAVLFARGFAAGV